MIANAIGLKSWEALKLVMFQPRSKGSLLLMHYLLRRLADETSSNSPGRRLIDLSHPETRAVFFRPLFWLLMDLTTAKPLLAKLPLLALRFFLQISNV